MEDQALGPAGIEPHALPQRRRFRRRSEPRDFKVYLLRTSTLQPRGAGFTLGWKQSPRGSVDGARPDDSTPVFRRDGGPGRVLRRRLGREDLFPSAGGPAHPCAGRSAFNRAKIFEAVNVYAGGLSRCSGSMPPWPEWVCSIRTSPRWSSGSPQAREKGSCLLCLGWGGGLTAKSAWLDTTNADYREILRQYAIYNRALATNLPFPKTRRIVFLNNKPATLPGWAELTVE